MADYISETHYKDLEVCRPESVVQQTGCAWDPVSQTYTLTVWNHEYQVELSQRRIVAQEGAPPTFGEYLHLFILFYLIKAQKKQVSGTWVSEKDLVGGAAFFRGPHILPVDQITDRVKNDLGLFEKICKGLGGRPVNFADAAFSFQITPQIPVAVLYWQGDEDFPAEAKLLFDSTIEAHLPLDIVFALAVEVCCVVARAD